MRRSPGRRLWNRLLPQPLVSLGLFVAWLMLNESASAGQGLLGAALALGVPWLSSRFSPDRPRIKSWRPVPRLVAVVLYDIVKSNIEVARRVLGPEAAIQPRFVWVPVDLKDPQAVVLLACIVTTTPGTLSAGLSADRQHLLVHALHCPDEAAATAVAADIRARYQAPLKEIFE